MSIRSSFQALLMGFEDLVSAVKALELSGAGAIVRGEKWIRRGGGEPRQSVSCDVMTGILEVGG